MEPKKKPIPLQWVLDQLYSSSSNTMLLDSNGVTMYSSQLVIETLIDLYYDYYFMMPKIYEDPNNDYDYANYFMAMWSAFKSANIANLKNAYDAMAAVYDPISNYDMTETGADGKRKDKTDTSLEPSGTTTTTNTLYRTGANSTGDGVLTDKSVTNVAYTLAKTDGTETPSNTQSMTFDGTTHTGYHEATEHFLSRSGNIGVTTSQQMILSEIDLRHHDLLFDYISRFAERYLFYVG